MIDVGGAIRAGLVIGLADGVAKIGDFVGLEAAGDAHFVEIGVSREGQKAGMLVLPAEAANGGLARGLENGNVEDLTANLLVVFLTLFPGEVHESLIRDRFHKAIAQEVQRNAECANFLRVRHALLNFRGGEGAVWANGAVVHQCAALDDFRPASNGYIWVYELAVGATMADAQFGDLAGAAGSGILMAFAARLRVVEWAEAVGDGFGFLKLGLIGGVRGVVDHAIGFIGKTGGSFGKR